MDHRLIEGLMEAIAPVVRESIGRAIAPLVKRIADLEAREPLRGEPGAPGESVTLDDVQPMLEAMVAALPAPEPGKSVTLDDVRPVIEEAIGALPKPEDGKSVSIDDVAPLIVSEIAKAVAALPAPKDGEPGAPGEKGERGDKGIDGASVAIDDVAPLIVSEIAKAVAALPAPKDGEPGAPGEKGEPGRDGRDASDIPMLRGFIAEQVNVTFGEVFKTLSMTSPDDGRTLVFAADFNGASVRQEIKTALVLDNGVWRPDAFEKGSGVSFGGSFFIAQEDTADKPETSKAWRLAVKRGRDGRDGKPGDRGPAGAKGDRGEQGPRGYGT